MNIVDTLRFFRQKLKLRQKDMMAEYADPCSYSKIESGTRSLYENQRDFTTKKFACTILTNLISLCLYAQDYEGAAKYISLAKKQDKRNENYNFKLNLHYLTNLLNYLVDGELIYIERVYNFIQLLENTGDTLQAELVKKEVKLLTYKKNEQQALENYTIGLLKEN